MAFDAADNAGWSLVGGQPTTTIAGPIAPGGSAQVEIVLDVTGNGPSLVNDAEITSAADEDGTVRPDLDSTPDADADNDELTDDVIDETPATGDEDDHDIAEVSAPVFDLALRKTRAADQPKVVYVGEDVTFTITVFNQGEVTATDIDVVDELPNGMAFDAALNPNWTEDGPQLTTTIAGPLAPGASVRVDLTLRVVSGTGDEVDNLAEITSAADTTGRTPPDVDSTPDTDLGNDELVDDVIDSTPGGDPADEDDHDIAPVITPVWDLALRKVLADGQASTVKRRDTVRFTITVFNQGSASATDIVVRDAVPNGLNFDPADNPSWTSTSVGPVATIAGPLAPGGSASVDIVLTVGNDVMPSLTNIAEILDSTDEDGHHPPDIDSLGDDDERNDTTVDDVVDNADGDEDDNDPASIVVEDATVPTSTPVTHANSPTSDPQGSSPTEDIVQTGSDVAPLVGLGLGLILLGFGFRHLRRRRSLTSCA